MQEVSGSIPLGSTNFLAHGSFASLNASAEAAKAWPAVAACIGPTMLCYAAWKKLKRLRPPLFER